jgi:hypothetical protein
MFLVASINCFGQPAITSQPQSLTNLAGTTATFSVTVTGTPPLAHQWLFNSTIALSGQTNAGLTLTNVQSLNAGDYSVIVTNVQGAVTSILASLTVIAPPTISSQPFSQNTIVGTDAIFDVGVLGTAPFYYQWQFKGTNLPGATNSALTLTNVQTTDAGDYSVIITNLAGSVASVIAHLSVFSQVRQAWAARYNFPGNAFALAVDGSGNVYVTGDSCDGSGCGYVTVKYDANGNQLWTARYADAAISGNAALGVDSAGNVYLIGSSSGTNSFLKYVTVKYDANGNQLWVTRYSGSGFDNVAMALGLDGEGSAYVTGYSIGTNGSAEYATVKYDANGNQLWVARYKGPGNCGDVPGHLALDTAGNAYVTGSSCGTDGSESATVKYDANGRQLWVARYPGLDDLGYFRNNPAALKVDTAGNVYVTGSSSSLDELGVRHTGYATVKYDANGRQLWIARYTSLPAYSADSFGLLSFAGARALAVDTAGHVYVTGDSGVLHGGHAGEVVFRAKDYVTVKYDANGNELWATRYSGNPLVVPRYNGGSRLALDTNGNTYVTGGVIDIDGYSHYATVKYDTNGNQLWIARFKRSCYCGNDAGIALAVDGAGDVYVTGTSADALGVLGYTTVKYVQTQVDSSPTIATPPRPQYQTAFAGTNISFSVTAAGAQPLSYQWRFNGANVPGATNASLTVTNVRISGDYSVEVANSAGLTVSSEARVMILSELRVSAGLTNGGFQFTLVGELYHPYRIDVSTNLQQWTSWADGFLNLSDGSTIQFADSSTNFPRRFYRAASP